MSWLDKFSLRSFIFGVGAIGAAAQAVDIAQRADLQVTPAHLFAAACVAVAGFAAKWPTDVTADEAKQREQRARRESMLPPAGDEP